MASPIAKARCAVLEHEWVRVGGVEGIVRCTHCGKKKEAPGQPGLITVI